MSTVSPAERVLDLVIALRHASGRMTRNEIRTRVAGYGEAENDAAFERMFERDKTALRDLGIPLLTLTDGTHGDDIGYRIGEDYELPALDLTPEEIGVLAVAAQVWEGAELRARALRALTKLRAVAPTSSRDLAGHALRIPTPDDAFDALVEAASQRTVVTFDYRAARTGSTERRDVEPWRLIVRDGGWYLQAWDRIRGGERLFRLSRISSRVRPSGAAGEHPVGAPPAPGEPVGEARVLVRPERASALRLRATTTTPSETGDDLLTLPLGDVGELAALIAGYTDSVLVLSPPALRDAVVARLRAVAALGALR